MARFWSLRCASFTARSDFLRLIFAVEEAEPSSSALRESEVSWAGAGSAAGAGVDNDVFAVAVRAGVGIENVI